MVINKTIVQELAKEDKRVDGRNLSDFRDPVTVEVGVSPSAEGSARVKIGKTDVLIGVKLAIEKPYNDTPDEGGIMVNAELTPLSSPQYDSGPPQIKAIELSRVIDRGIRESKAIDLKKLCIEKGEKAWFIAIDIVSVNDDGNLFDASGLGAMAALRNTVFPEVDSDGIIDYEKKTKKPLPITKDALPVTVCKVNGKLFIDPLRVEEEAVDSRLTVASTADGTIVALQKGGETPLRVEDISEMVDVALEKATFLREKLTQAVS